MKENKRGQFSLGIIITVAIAIIVGLILFQSIAGNVENGTQSNGATTATNALYTGVLNSPVELTGQELVSVTGVTNRTGGNTVVPANYTIAECVRTTDNLKGICYKSLGVGLGGATVSGNSTVLVTYTYYPSGYIDDSGGRSITAIIILLAAIAIDLRLKLFPTSNAETFPALPLYFF